MAISEWRTPDEQARHDKCRPKKSRSRFYEREATEHQRRLIDLKRELREESDRIKAEQARATLWTTSTPRVCWLKPWRLKNVPVSCRPKRY